MICVVYYQEPMNCYMPLYMYAGIIMCFAPLYGTRTGLVGDLINKLYYVLFIIDVHRFNAQIPYQAHPSPGSGARSTRLPW